MDVKEEYVREWLGDSEHGEVGMKQENLQNVRIASMRNVGEYGSNELIKNIGLLHTTELGVERIKRNLDLATDDVVAWCRQSILSAKKIQRNGKNWYVDAGTSIITINAHSYTIITAHKK